MRLVALLVVVCAVAACSPAGSESVAAAQSTLRPPAITLGETLIRTQRTMDSIRHEVPRGQPMKEALATVPAEIAALRSTADQLDALAGNLDASHSKTGQAVQTVRGLTRLARSVATVAESEAAAYGRLADLDIAIDGIVTGWDEGGSQRERRSALQASAKEAATLATRATAESPHPGACPMLRDNRARWSRLVSERSAKLAGLATSASGATYDELRDRYRPEPYGVSDRLAADAADRSCWMAHSAVATAEAKARAAIARLKELLQDS